MTPATLSNEQRQDLLRILKERFEKNMKRHEGLEWTDLQARLLRRSGALWSLSEMERTGGEPDVLGRDKDTGKYVFFDCSAESPEGRRNVCYDHEGQKKREKEGLRPAGTFWIWQPQWGLSR